MMEACFHLTRAARRPTANAYVGTGPLTIAGACPNWGHEGRLLHNLELVMLHGYPCHDLASWHAWWDGFCSSF